MDYEKMHEFLGALDGRAPGSEREALARLEDLGFSIPALLVKRYKNSRRWSDRAMCVSHCMDYSKTNESAYQLGILALEDRSKTVRRMACRLLSVAQRREAIDHLEKLLTDEALKSDALAAIDAISKSKRRSC